MRLSLLALHTPTDPRRPNHLPSPISDLICARVTRVAVKARTGVAPACLLPAPPAPRPHLMAQHARQIPFKLRWDVCLQTNKAGRQGTRARNCWAGRVSEKEREWVIVGVGGGTKICPFSFIYWRSKIAAIVLNANA